MNGRVRWISHNREEAIEGEKGPGRYCLPFSLYQREKNKGKLVSFLLRRFRGESCQKPLMPPALMG